MHGLEVSDRLKQLAGRLQDRQKDISGTPDEQRLGRAVLQMVSEEVLRTAHQIARPHELVGEPFPPFSS